MKNERNYGDSKYGTFVVKNSVLEKYDGDEENVRLPGFIFTVGEKAFEGNTFLKTVRLSSTATAIMNSAFSGCKALEQMFLPFDLQSIGESAFNGCAALTRIIFNGDKERWLAIKKGKNWLDGTPDLVITCKDAAITKQEEIEYESEPSVDFDALSRDVLKEPKQKSLDDERIAYRERRHRELIKKINLFSDDCEDNDDDDEDDDEDGDEEIGEEELRFEALKLCIERNMASVSLFQRTFPIGYIRACKLIEWMESEGYVSAAYGSTPREVLITKEDFKKLYGKPRLIEEEKFDDEEFNDEEDKKFAEYEKYLSENFPDVEDDGGKLIGCDEFMEQLFGSDVKKKDAPLLDLAKRNEAAQNLVNVLSQIIAKKSAPISADVMPAHPSWDNEDEFNNCVMDRLERLIKSDKRMGLKSAVKRAEIYLEAVRDTHDRKMVEVYERLVYKIKNTSSYLYKQLKKQFFGE